MGVEDEAFGTEAEVGTGQTSNEGQWNSTCADSRKGRGCDPSGWEEIIEAPRYRSAGPERVAVARRSGSSAEDSTEWSS